MKVLNFGSLNFDMVYSVDHITEPKETQSSIKMEVFFGGKGFNQSVALSKAGVAVYHAGTIGEDGTAFLDICKNYGIDSSNIYQSVGKTGHAIIQVDKNGENNILIYGGANQKQTKKHLDDVLAGFDAGDILLVQNEINLMEDLIDKASHKGMKIMLNPSPFDDTMHRCNLSKVSVLLLNEVEGRQLTGRNLPTEILDELKLRYPDTEIVLTLGSEGAIYQKHDYRYVQKCYPAKVVDTTAAGDTFTGYFIAGYTEGMNIKDNLDRCAKASAITVSRKGASVSIPLKGEVI